MAPSQGQFHRPIGITLLAAGAGLAALAEIWRMLVFLGIVDFTFVGKAVSFPEAQWGQAFWAWPSRRSGSGSRWGSGTFGRTPRSSGSSSACSR